MKNPFLIGERIYLRGLEEEDLNGNYIKWLNDSQVCRYNSHHRFPYDKEKGRTYIKYTQNTKDALVLAVILKENSSHVGNISLQAIDYINRNAEYAILIGDKDCWGKGYAKEASMIILEHGFMELNLHRIYCGTSSKNKGMQKLAVSLGMTQEGRRKEAIYKNGKFLDMVEYGLLKARFIEILNSCPKKPEEIPER